MGVVVGNNLVTSVPDGEEMKKLRRQQEIGN